MVNRNYCFYRGLTTPSYTMNVNNSPLRGQSPPYRDFQDRDFAQTDLFLEEMEKGIVKNPTALVSNDNQVRILCVLNQCFPLALKATQISDAAYIHRSTVSVNTRELIELGLIEKTIAPGTENHINPTLLFRLSEAHKEEVQVFLSVKLNVQPHLRTVYPPEPVSTETNQDTVPSVAVDSVEPEQVNAVAEEHVVGFEEQVKQGFKMIAERLLAMQDEIDELRQRLNEKPRPQTDLSEVFDIFASRNSRSSQGAKQ